MAISMWATFSRSIVFFRPRWKTRRATAPGQSTVTGSGTLLIDGAAGPNVPIDQPDPQVGAGTGKMQRRKALLVEQRGTGVELPDVGLPIRHRIVAGDAGRGKDRAPQQIDRFRPPREHRLSPRLVRERDDRPDP